MNNKQRTVLIRIFSSAVCLVLLFFLRISGTFSGRSVFSVNFEFLVFLLAYFLVGYDVIFKSFESLLVENIFDENLLMFVASAGAFCLGKYFEAVFVMLLYQVGELFQSYVLWHSKNSMLSLINIKPEYVNLKTENDVRKMSPSAAKVGDLIVVKPGEKIPLDGVIVSGRSQVDCSSMTGEIAFKNLGCGDNVISGCVNITGLLEVEVLKPYSESAAKKVLDLLENSKDNEAKTERFIRKFAKIYTPSVVCFALLFFVVSVVFFKISWKVCLEKSLIFLVISCPCALVVSVPISFFGGIAKAAKNGILIKSGSVLENISRAIVTIFDKTGTLTQGKFSLVQINSKNISDSELIGIIASVEKNLNHPIAVSLASLCENNFKRYVVCDVVEKFGRGVEAFVDGRKVQLGNLKFMKELGILVEDDSLNGTVVHVAIDGEYAGNVVLEDCLRENSKKVVEDLKNEGIEKVLMFTGDCEHAGKSVARTLNLDFAFCDLLPFNKVEKLKYFLDENKGKGKIIFVGDGVNDAPVMVNSDVGIAMGKTGSDVTLEAADVVLVGDDLEKLPVAIKISRKTIKIVSQNVLLALLAKLLVIISTFFNISNIWFFAIFADVGVLVVTILNALRTLGKKV